MTEYRKTNHVLPEATVGHFKVLETEMKPRNILALALRDAGWTLQSIAVASGMTRERVRQVTGALRDSGEWGDDKPAAYLLETYGFTVPSPPRKETVTRTRREYTEPDPEKLARMLELKPVAEKVRANSPEGREEAEEYTKLIADSHLKDGVSLYRLALRLGVTHGALRFRLVRYGYIEPKTGRSRVYTKVDPKNRPGGTQEIVAVIR